MRLGYINYSALQRNKCDGIPPAEWQRLYKSNPGCDGGTHGISESTF
nr:MAG TPA: hypothetical protein [Caudoviricetes sp.]